MTTVESETFSGEPMPRFWTCHWGFNNWKPSINLEGEPLRRSGSNSFKKRGVAVGDSVYIVSIHEGRLYLGGRMTVKKIVTRAQAMRLWKTRNLYAADEWIVDPDEEGTPLVLQRRLSPTLAKRLRFKSKVEVKGLCFVSETALDGQATRGVRELTPESAQLLDHILAATDSLKRRSLLTVTEEMIPKVEVDPAQLLPDELALGTIYREGGRYRVLVNAYERSPEARRRCIDAHGTACCVCGFSFGATYGPTVEGYVHIHHLRPLAEIGEEYEVDPVADLRPVCPNCHAVIHLHDPSRSIEEVREMMKSAKAN